MTNREDILILSDLDQRQFQAWEELFDSDGWLLLKKELEQEVEDLPQRAFESAATWDEVLAARASVAKLREILSYPDFIEARRQEAISARLQELDDEFPENDRYV